MAGQISDYFSTESELFRSYLFYCSLLVLKMLVMSPLTGLQRYKNMAFVNPEDASMLKGKPRTDENVERVRRAHLNDVENIPIFFVAGLIYILTNPPTTWAILLFKTFTAARFVHTFVYAIFVVPQPARMLAYVVGLFITGYMAFQGAVHFM